MRYFVRMATIALWFVAGSGRLFAATVSLSAPASVVSGQNVTVEVRLSDDLTGVYALQAGFTYDPAVLTLQPNQ